jgi:tRNA(Ile)-lysidine synthase TilS/MesJ
MNPAERLLSSLIAKAVQDFAMIQSGDRILIAASGGKDSTSLAYDFSRRIRYNRVPFEIAAVHIATEFSPASVRANLSRLFAEWEVPLHVIDVAVLERLKPGRKMNCYWCSTQRRTKLINFAVKNGFNKLALGHHLDDIVETLFMNMMQKGEISTMIPVMPYRKYPLTILRPLALVEERQIIRFIKSMDLDGSTCTCSFGDNSSRKEIRERIKLMTKDNSSVKRLIFRSLSKVNPEYLL